jgi:hypothetical protein
VEVVEELSYQEELENWQRWQHTASIMAIIASIFGKRKHKPKEFMPPIPKHPRKVRREKEMKDFQVMCGKLGVKPPKWEVKGGSR